MHKHRQFIQSVAYWIRNGIDCTKHKCC